MNDLQTASRFDYSALPPALAEEAQAVAKRVRDMHQRTVGNILEMGRELLTIKAQLDHGQFGLWLKAEFDGVARTAQNYMSAAERLGDKSETISHLPVTTVYALAAPSTPDPIRNELIQELEAGAALGPSEVSRRIGDAKYQIKEQRRKRQLAEQRTSGSAKKAGGDERARAKLERLVQREEESQRLRHDALCRAVEIVRGRLTDEDVATLIPLVEILEPTPQNEFHRGVWRTLVLGVLSN